MNIDQYEVEEAKKLWLIMSPELRAKIVALLDSDGGIPKERVAFGSGSNRAYNTIKEYYKDHPTIDDLTCERLISAGLVQNAGIATSYTCNADGTNSPHDFTPGYKLTPLGEVVARIAKVLNAEERIREIVREELAKL